MLNIDLNTVKQTAHGQWFEIIPALDSRFSEAVEKVGNHVPCPIGTGSKDGFRFEPSSATDGHAFTNTGESLGSGFDLLMWANGWNFRETLEAVSQYLGNPDNPTQKQPTKIISHETKPEKPNPIPAKLWRESKAEFSEPVRAYLNSRGLGEIKELPTTLRCHPSIKYRDNETTGNYPALIGSIIKGDELAGIQRHYLTNEGNKADVKNNKLMKGVFKNGCVGGAVRLNEPTDTLAITEGIETGLSVQLATGVPTWSTCTAALMGKVEIPDSVQTVFIFADKDPLTQKQIEKGETKGVGEKSANTLAERLRNQGKKAFILMPPMAIPENTKGVDWLNVLNKEGKEPFKLALKVIGTTEENPPEEKLTTTSKNMMDENIKEIKKELLAKVEKLNETYSLATVGDKTRIMRYVLDTETNKKEIEMLQIQAFRDIFNNQQVKTGINKKTHEETYKPLGTVWMAHYARQTYSEGIYFLPMKDPLKNGTYQKYENKLNLWRGFGVDRATYIESKIKIFTDHIFKVICNSNEIYYNYLIKWIAYGFQYPEKLAEVAVVLRGEKGTGKGSLGKLLKKLYGRHSLQISSSKHLVGNFNNHLRDCCFLFADEAFFAGDNAGNQSLKALITESSMIIEGKGIDAQQTSNRLKILMASNSDWVVPSSKDERRYFCLDMPEIETDPVKIEEWKKYYTNLHNAIGNNEQCSMLLDYLLSIDLTGFNIRGYPETEANKEQRYESLSPIARFLLDACDREFLITYKTQPQPQWFERVTTNLIMEALNEWGRHNFRSNYDRPTRKTITDYLKSLGLINKKYRNINEYANNTIIFHKDRKKGYDIESSEQLKQRIIDYERLPED